MAYVAESETLPVRIYVFSERDNFEKLAHFMRVNQLLYCRCGGQIGRSIRMARLCQKIGDAQIQKKIGLGGVAD